MIIGSHYNFNQDSTRYKSEILSDFIRDRNKLPRNLIVYFVVGTEIYNSDELVPARSVLAGRYIYQGVVKQFTAISVSGNNAQHSVK